MNKPAENPYIDGHRAWLEITGGDVQAKKDYRLIAIACICVALLCAGGMIAMSLQHKIVPYAVELNEHSEVVRVTRADVMGQPNASQIKAALRDWIIGARSVWGDKRAQQHMLDTTYAITFPDSPAYETLTTFHKGNNPYDRSKTETVEINVHSVTLISGDTWRIEWTETTKKLSGQVVDSKVWQGSFTIAIAPPVDEKQIFINPLGVYVKGFTWVNRL